MPRSEYGPSPEQFAARLRALIEAKAPVVRGRPSLRAASELIRERYPDLFYETLYKYLAPRRQRGSVLPPQVPSWSQLYKIATVLEIDPADLFAPFDEEQ